MKKKILVVEDEKKIRRFIRANLLASGYDVCLAADGKAALEAFETFQPDIVLLDIMLPEMDGFQVLKRIREISDLPVIILTVKDSSSSIVRGLELGADDYMTKPFDINELLARIKAVLRRCKTNIEKDGGGPLTAGKLQVSVSGFSVSVGEREIRLTPTEFKLLLKLLKNKDRVLTHEKLLAGVWGPEYRDETHYLRVCVARIRNKLGIAEGEPGYIQTVPTVGYKLLGGGTKVDYNHA